jgi:hypothetical protein
MPGGAVFAIRQNPKFLLEFVREPQELSCRSISAWIRAVFSNWIVRRHGGNDSRLLPHIFELCKSSSGNDQFGAVRDLHQHGQLHN